MDRNPHLKPSAASVGKSTVGHPSTAACSSTSDANYFAPLQTLMDTDDAVSNPSGIRKAQSSDKSSATPKPPPIVAIKTNCSLMHKMLEDNGITDYALKRMSIGLKILPKSMETFNKICATLKKVQCEYFTHSLKSELPFKVTLTGLDDFDPAALKNYLLSADIKCTDVKTVTRKSRHGSFTIYIIYIERGTITLKELKQNHGIINRTVVRWDFHRKLPNKLTQCYNCQMYGHGAMHCHIKTFCLHCSGPHKTSNCETQNALKCANCNGNHRSSDPQCPSRRNYVEFRERIATKKTSYTLPTRGFTSQEADFPRLPRSSQAHNPIYNPNWSSLRNNTINNVNRNNSLFSISELQTLTSELIAKLRDCKDKYDQFKVVTELALKYLNNNGP